MALDLTADPHPHRCSDGRERPCARPPLAARGADRAAAIQACIDKAVAKADWRSLAGCSVAQKLAWRRWAPLIVSLPGLARRPRADKRALVEVVRAKAAPSELDYIRRFNAHPRLARALLGQKA